MARRQELEDLLEANKRQYDAISLLNGSEPFASRVSKALELLLNYFEADRVYTMRFDEGYHFIRNTFERVRPGVSPQIDLLQRVPMSTAPRWLTAFEQGQAIIEADIERIKTLYPPEYAIMKGQGISRYVEAPIRSNGRLIGFVGIDNPVAKKLVYSSNLLLAFAYGLGNVLDQNASEKALQQSRDLYETATKLANIAVWVYDLKQKRIIISDSEVAREESKRYGIPRVIENAPEATEPFIDPMDIPKVREAYAAVARGEPKVVCDYWYKTPEGMQRHRERMVYTTLYDEKGQPSSAIGIGLDITADTLLQENYDRSMESLLRSNPQAVESFHFDLTDNKTLESHFSSMNSKKLLQNDSADGFFEGVASLIISTTEQAEYRAKTSRSGLLAAFGQGVSNFSLAYRRKTVEGRSRDVKAYFTLLENPGSGHIECFVYAEDTTEQKRKEEIFRYVADEECDAVTVLHIREKTFEIFAVSPRLVDPTHPVDALVGRSLPYEEKSRFNILSWIEADKRDYYAAITSLEAIKKALAEHSPYEINILGHDRLPPYGPTCRRLQFSYLDNEHNDVLLIQTDVTTTYLQQEREAELAKEKAKKATDILDSVSNGIVVFHMDDETHLEGEFVNLQMFRFLGFEAEKESDRRSLMADPTIKAYLANAFAAVDPADLARVKAAFVKGYHEDHFSVEPYKITKKDGTQVYVTTDLILKEKPGDRHIYYASYRLVEKG
jgi:PAS domain-containing protein